jgi:hypothetical protein
MTKKNVTRLIQKSTKATAEVARGNIILGKYTLLMRFEFATRLDDASLRTVENRNQGSMPANTMRG